MTAARQIRDELAGTAPPPEVALRANVVVTDTPFDDGDVLGFIDSSDGQLLIDDGHLDDPELTITTDYATAHALFVGQDLQAIMTAFLGGKIRLTGDVSKILNLQPPTDPDQLSAAGELAARLSAITDPAE